MSNDKTRAQISETRKRIELCKANTANWISSNCFNGYRLMHIGGCIGDAERAIIHACANFGTSKAKEFIEEANERIEFTESILKAKPTTYNF